MTFVTIILNEKDNFGSTAFHYCASFGSTQLARMIIQKSVQFGIDLNAKNKVGRTAFTVACEAARTLELTELMIEKSA